MKTTFTFIALLLLAISAQAQTVISGQIFDLNGKPLPNVHVLISGMSSGHTHSNLAGFFEVSEAVEGDTLTFSHLGFVEETYVVAGPASLQIQLIPGSISLEVVSISPGLEAQQTFTAIDHQLRPVVASEEILQRVPGLFIGQHAGGGKAEQLFLRGFDLDHGTDIALAVDGLPVNMVSHAHGQGYSDLHFVIPELIEQIDFSKGPHSVETGNFATAGQVNLRTYETLPESSVGLTVGQFNSQRLFTGLQLLDQKNQSAYIAASHYLTDGPFESQQNLERTNFFGKYNFGPSDSRSSVAVGYFHSQWDASGQVPLRAVRSGLIDRFGAIDDTEGGRTGRTNVQFSHYRKLAGGTSWIEADAYFSDYHFDLFSNFTFFNRDSINGDQIQQRERRNLVGSNFTYNAIYPTSGGELLFKAGSSLRHDRVSGNELSYTKNRTELLERVQFGDINETNLSVFSSLAYEGERFRASVGLRADQFEFIYQDLLADSFARNSASAFLLSPKLSLSYRASGQLQFFLKAGSGFHTNDTRLITGPSTSEESQPLAFAPRAFGVDLGASWKPFAQFILNATLWSLHSQQEFVYVGDEGIVEASDPSRRLGAEMSLRWQPLPVLFLHTDLTYSHARSMGAYIPLAPAVTMTGGGSLRLPSGFFSSLEVRHLADRAADETYKLTAEGYWLAEMTAGYEWKSVEFSASVFNLLNTEWNEAQFATESRLAGEASAVEEIHFTPGAPRSVRASLRYKF